MARYRVELDTDGVAVLVNVAAYACDVQQDGTLVFRDEESRLTRAFRPGLWLQVTRVTNPTLEETTPNNGRRARNG